jgi:hypothetical protein
MNGGSDTTIKTLPTKIAESALALGEALSGSAVRRMSVHDATGHVVWSNGEPLQHDEQDFVLDALDAFALDAARLTLERDSVAATGLVAFAARDPRGALHGALLLDVELATLGGRPGERLMPTRGERLLRQLALRLASGVRRASAQPVTTFDGQTLTLYVQQLLKLGAAGRSRRYEVLLRSRNPASGELEVPAGTNTSPTTLSTARLP